MDKPTSAMTAEIFARWRKSLAMTQTEAGDALGLTKRTVQLYEAGTQPVPLSVALACRAVELGWRDYDTQGLNIKPSQHP